MRIAESITLPVELERARVAGELVVFAGAGVSMGPPANLPSFRELAQTIAEPVVMLGDRTDLDKYLGEAERAGVLVQRRTHELLQNGGSHTPLHEYLVGLFGSAERVRLITTNFDPHFTSAAAQMYPGLPLRHYIGPALPPGARFSGIAHLHGALASDQDRLVLTAADFAEAYMAEGWAARFLVRVFADRTVLFVGYSVSDPIIQYLLQALPPTGRWFGLWHDTETPPAGYPITPVTFRTAANGDRYGDLNDGLRVWHWYATAPPSDHERKLQSLIAAGPPASVLDADYIRARIDTDPGRIVFLSNATTERWFAWAIEEGLLECLIQPEGDDWDNAWRWSRWCLTNFCAGENPALLRFVRTRSLTLHPAFLVELRRHLCASEALPPTPVLRQLIALVISESATGQARPHDWGWLIEVLVKAGHTQEALAVVRVATRLRLAPIEHLYSTFEEDDENKLAALSVRLRTFVPPKELEDVLVKCGEAMAAADADALLLLGEQRISEAYELLDLARGTSGDFDWLSFGRTAIAASDQDAFAHADDVLIILVRTVLDYWAGTASGRLRQFAEQHVDSQRTILKRLSLYALSKCDDCPANEILSLLRRERSAQSAWLRPELYLVLKRHYAAASEEARSSFIEALRDETTWGEEFDEHDAHARFSISRKLLRDAPDSEATKAFARAEGKAHPEWGESDRDGYLSRISVGWGGSEAPSPIESAEMVTWDASEALTKIADTLRESRGTAQWQSILGAVQQGVKAAPDWGARLVERAVAGDDTDDHIAEAALWSLRDARPSDDAQISMLYTLRDARLAERLLSPLSMIITQWAREIPKGGEQALLNALDSVADKLFVESRDVKPGIVGRGWTESAINHPAGHAAQVWWSVANSRDWLGDQFVYSLDDDERERWKKVVSDETPSGAYSRPILGMAVDRLSVADAPWADTEVFPYFDPARGPDRAAQLWDGRLMQSHWSWATVGALKPYFDSLFQVSGSLIPERSSQLGDWVAFLLANREKSGLTLRSLQLFIRSATEEARVAFADALPKHVERLSSEQRLQLWDAVLSPYWSDRRTNMPAPLSNAEIREMMWWVIALPEASEHVLQALRKTDCHNLEHADDLIWRWKHDDDAWLVAHPTEAAGIVAFLAERNSLNPWMTEVAVAVLGRAVDVGAAQDIVLQGAEALVALGSQSAPALVERLRAT